jgi:hypothetical protein
MIDGYWWPGGIVYYTIDPGMSSQYRINDAISYWQTHTNIVFVQEQAKPTMLLLLMFQTAAHHLLVSRVGSNISISVQVVQPET